jgi:hypothetical protein
MAAAAALSAADKHKPRCESVVDLSTCAVFECKTCSCSRPAKLAVAVGLHHYTLLLQAHLAVSIWHLHLKLLLVAK